MVNIGCGASYHAAWVNLDAAPCSPQVRACDIREPLPFADASVDVVYHSHVLEHLNAIDGARFMRECFRILRPGGVLRVVVPDLEGIARAYLGSIDQAADGADTVLHAWTRMELTDQAARVASGGEMLPWLRSLTPEELARVRLRAGRELDYILRTPAPPAPWWRRITLRSGWAKLRVGIVNTAVRLLGGRTVRAALDEGRFRQSGEVHRVMYDRVSLSRLLVSSGFVKPTVMAASSSDIPSFNDFGLDTVQGSVRKPDSLFMEAVRP